jgi:beta-glucosidase
LVFVLASLPAHAQLSPSSIPARGGLAPTINATTREARQIDALLSRMTLEEKLGQLSQWSGGLTLTGPLAAAGSEDDIRKGRVGSFLGISGTEATLRLQHIAVDETRMHVPLLFAFDVIHGFRTTFPIPLAEAATWDVGLAERCARAAAKEASAYGIDWVFAPMVDIARDPRWGRVIEGAGEDPYLGSAFAAARVRGFQNGPRGEPSSVLATAKHFVAYGAAEAGRDYNPVDISERTLREVYLPPFRAAVENGVASVMTAFNEVDGVPMHANAALVRDALRKRLGFNGVVVSDYTGIKELMAHGVAADRAEAGTLALEATIDVDMVSSIYLQDLPALIRSHQLPQKLVDDAVRRVLRAKQQLGLFDDPYRFSDPAREQAQTLTPEARALAREAGDKAIVLLKNEQVLPLARDLGHVLVVGALANSGRSSLGAWSALGRAEDVVSVLDGIRGAVSQRTRVMYARGAGASSDDRSGIAEAVTQAKHADVVIAVVGETNDQNGEARSRSRLGLPGAQLELVQQLMAAGKPVVVVLMNGRPLTLGALQDRAPAIVEAWALGVEMGHCVADVLFGAVNPSGKLPVTFPRAVGQEPLYYAHKNSGRPPSATDPYTSKYIDVPWTPLYPFGYGLSYTSFSYDAPRLSSERIGPEDTLKVSVTVSNTGKRAGEEIVQLYLRDDVASITRPVEQLRGFTRVALQPGASRQVEFSLDREDFAMLDANFAPVVEKGAFTVFVGGNSRDVQSAHFEVTKSLRLKAAPPATPKFMRGGAAAPPPPSAAAAAAKPTAVAGPAATAERTKLAPRPSAPTKPAADSTAQPAPAAPK